MGESNCRRHEHQSSARRRWRRPSTRAASAPRSRPPRAGNIPPEAAIEAPIAQRLKVEEFARSFPGIGTVKAKVIVKALDIPDGRRVSGLGYMQGPRLVAFIKNNMTAKEDGQ